ncbi:MAG TPA: hypothetical protein VET25_00275, partial [Aestuariivirgaceae bacterium]|nr:hypothetical protein [Aestuariivirgaceae bacterium]
FGLGQIELGQDLAEFGFAKGALVTIKTGQSDRNLTVESLLHLGKQESLLMYRNQDIETMPRQ